MFKHEHFEELCSLAVIGELSPEEVNEFTLHLKECKACRSRYQAVSEVATEFIPFSSKIHSRVSKESVERLREGVLQRISTDSGLRFSEEAVQGSIAFKDRLGAIIDDLRWSFLGHKAAFATSVAIITLLGVGIIAVRHDRTRTLEIESLRAEVIVGRQATTELHDSLALSSKAKTIAVSDAEQLERQLADAAARANRLELQRAQDLKTLASLQADVNRLTQDNKSLVQRVANKDGELAGVTAQLQQLQSRTDNKNAELVAAQLQLNELSNRMKVQQAALDRERQFLAAGRDIRDVMASRNLHIIDVHDVDSHGESRPFGRIFLTEGKRLIFYAYDLNSAKVKNASFQAWGVRPDGERGAVNLGIMYLDDRKQSRWALKVDNPNVLAAIESVFVTIEPEGGVKKPTGKKLMYAYLRNPINHP